MLNKSLTTRIESILTSDPDDLPGLAVTISPSEQSDALSFLVSVAESTVQNRKRRLNSIRFASAVLSSQSPILTTQEAKSLVRRVLKSLRSSKDETFREPLLLLSTYLLDRVPLSSQTRIDVLDAYKAVRAKYGSEEDSLISQLVQRESRLQSAFSRSINHATGKTDGIRSSFDDLDVTLALRNVRLDGKKDWYFDPWNWPEISWIARKRKDLVVERAKSNHVGFVIKLDVAKDATSTRPAVIMDPLDRLAYQSLVDKVSLDLIGEMPEWVYGWRLARKDTRRGQYEDNREEWLRYKKHFSECMQKFRHGIRLDIKSFFPGVLPSVAFRQMIRKCRAYSVLERLEVYLHGWNNQSSRTGLPQRFLASSAIAQSFLSPLDEYVERVVKSSNGRIEVIRWVDDFWVFGVDRNRIDGVARELDALLNQLGLEFNSAKTLSFDTKEPPLALQFINASGLEHDISSALDPSQMIRDKTREMLECDNTRSNLSLLAKLIRKTSDPDAIRQIERQMNSNALTHAADKIAVLLRETNRWKHLQGWYCKYVDAHVLPSDWSLGAWGKMFPFLIEEKDIMVEKYFARRLGKGLQKTLVPLAAHRLSKWNAEAAAPVIRDSADSSTCPFEMRALSFSGLQSGLPKRLIRDWLASFVGHECFPEFLASTRYKAPEWSMPERHAQRK